MSLLEKNLRALGNSNPQILELLAEKYVNANIVDSIEWQINGAGEPVAFFKKNRIGSVYSSKHMISVWLNQFEKQLNEDKLVYVFGVGTGEIVTQLDKYLCDESEVIIYEPSGEFFLQLLEHKDCSHWLQRENIHVIFDDIRQISIFDTLEDYFKTKYLRDEEIIVLHNPEYYGSFFDRIRIYFDQELLHWNVFVKQNQKTKAVWLDSDIMAPIKRMNYYQDAIVVERLREDWDKEIPVIIVAAGPSLKKNVKQLHRAKGHCLIVAVSRAVLFLKDEGIVPDIIADVDDRASYSTVAEQYKNVPLLCNTSMGEDTFNWNTAPKILSVEKPFIQYIKYKAGLPMVSYGMYGSVAIMAFSVMRMLGTKKIILVGQDLAYSPEGSSHAESDEPERGVTSVVGMDTLPGYYGGEVKTRADWLGFWDWYRRELVKTPECQVINATEGGASIPGTVQKSLQEVVDESIGKKLDIKRLYDSKYRVTEEEYDYMQGYIQDCKKELSTLSSWNQGEYKKNAHRLEKMKVYHLLQMVLEVSDEKDEWDAFAKSVCYLREKGWK